MDEEALIAWQDVLDMVVAGRPNDVACPFCKHRPLTIEEIDQLDADLVQQVQEVHPGSVHR